MDSQRFDSSFGVDLENDPDLKRLIDRIRRLDALVGEPDVRDSNGEVGNSFPQNVTSPDETNENMPSSILQEACEIMRQGDLSRPFFDSRLQDVLLQTEEKALNPLPPPEETQDLIRGYFQHFHPIFPIFQEVKLRELAHQMSTQQTTTLDAGSRACVYMVIAISYKLQLCRTSSAGVASAAWSYLNATMRFLPAISVAQPNLQNVQALAAMSIFLQGPIHFNQASRILGTAIYQLSSITQDIHAEEYWQTRRVLYILDKEFSLHSGLPPMMKLHHPTTNHPLEREGQFDSLQHFYSLAMIEEQIYKSLYSANARQECAEQLLDVANDLDIKLEAWRNSLPIEIKNAIGPNFSCDGSSSLLLLHLMYNNCLMAVHRLPAIHCPYTGLLSKHKSSSSSSSSDILSRIESSERKRTEAAWSCVQSVQYLDLNDDCPFWLIPSYIIASVILLLTSVLLDKENLHSQQNLSAMNSAVTFLESINDKYYGEFRQLHSIALGTMNIAQRIYSQCEQGAHARKIANVALENAVKEFRRGRKPRQTKTKTKINKRSRSDSGSDSKSPSDHDFSPPSGDFWWNRGASHLQEPCGTSDMLLAGPTDTVASNLYSSPLGGIPEHGFQNEWGLEGIAGGTDINWADYIFGLQAD